MSDGGVQITQRQVYDLLLEVRDEVRDLKRLPERVASVEGRLTDVERRQWTFPATLAVAIIAAAGSVVASIFA